MKKTIIAVYGTANVGKSITTAKLGRQIQVRGATTEDDISNDYYRAIFKYKNLKIGIQTYGDMESLVNEGLEYFKTDKCKVIVMPSKNYGGTTECIESFAKENGYKIIWCSPYQINENNQDEIEAIKSYCASHLLQMIDVVIGEF